MRKSRIEYKWSGLAQRADLMANMLNRQQRAICSLVHRSKCRAGIVQLAGSVQAALSQSIIKSRLIGTASRLVDSSNWNTM